LKNATYYFNFYDLNKKGREKADVINLSFLYLFASFLWAVLQYKQNRLLQKSGAQLLGNGGRQIGKEDYQI